MKRYKVIFKYKYGRSFKYTDIVRTENAQRLEIIKEIPINRLRGLAQAEKKGRLVVLPCKVGDTVYRIGASICKWREIDHCEEYCDGWQYRDCWDGTKTVLEEKFSLCDLESIDKTVFLTREAAEAALEERNAEHDVPMIDIEELTDLDQLKY